MIEQNGSAILGQREWKAGALLSSITAFLGSPARRAGLHSAANPVVAGTAAAKTPGRRGPGGFLRTVVSASLQLLQRQSKSRLRVQSARMGIMKS